MKERERKPADSRSSPPDFEAIGLRCGAARTDRVVVRTGTGTVAVNNINGHRPAYSEYSLPEFDSMDYSGCSMF